MAPETVQAILNETRSCWSLSNTPEITLEANPTSVEADRFEGYRSAGVNRLSLGVQALNDADLERLGRLHSVEQALAAYAMARQVFPRVSFDLIYSRQDQSLADWKTELARALDLAIDHLSLYQLTIEPETAFGKRYAAGGLHGLPDEDLAADMYDFTIETCRSADLHLYEVSNFAKPGSEGRHNILYWTGGDYLGIGPGAHGRLTIGGQRYATVAPSQPGKWLSGAAQDKVPNWSQERLPAQDQAEEYLMMGLRMASGLSLERLLALGVDSGMPERISRLVDGGSAGHWMATALPSQIADATCSMPSCGT